MNTDITFKIKALTLSLLINGAIFAATAHLFNGHIATKEEVTQIHQPDVQKKPNYELAGFLP